MRIQSILLWIHTYTYTLVGSFHLFSLKTPTYRDGWEDNYAFSMNDFLNPVKIDLNNRCFILKTENINIMTTPISKPEISTIVPSAQQTKEWRKSTEWYDTGKRNECEKHQIKVLEQILYPLKIEKTNDRIHMEWLKIVSHRTPLKCADGYEYTENFDGLIQKDDGRFYFNLKFVCDSGGAQTRTLREVYHFIRFQLEILLSNKNNIRQLSEEIKKSLYFVNILDGNTCCKSAKYFDYLIQKEKYRDVIENIFVGDLFTFQNCELAKILRELKEPTVPSNPPL